MASIFVYCEDKDVEGKRVADTLFISLATTQSHVKSLYRKLDVHSRQEIIDKVEEHRSSLG
jgi:DNA-binding CsgD family transcriptional regulator